MELERLREIERKRQGDDTGETEAELSQPFDPALATLDMIRAIGNFIADPIGTFITVDASPVESVASSEEEREREEQRQAEIEIDVENTREAYRKLAIEQDKELEVLREQQREIQREQEKREELKRERQAEIEPEAELEADKEERERQWEIDRQLENERARRHEAIHAANHGSDAQQSTARRRHRSRKATPAIHREVESESRGRRKHRADRRRGGFRIAHRAMPRRNEAQATQEHTQQAMTSEPYNNTAGEVGKDARHTPTPRPPIGRHGISGLKNGGISVQVYANHSQHPPLPL